jgi:hypothetical protein
MDPAVEELNSGNTGSAEMTIRHGIEGPLGEVTIDETFLVLIERDAENPRANSILYADVEGVMDVTATLMGTAGSHTTIGTVPINYTVKGTFDPYPKCEFVVQITEYIAFSEPVELDNTIIGDIDLPNGLGEDMVTGFPSVTLRGPTYLDASIPSLVVSLDQVILDGDSGCVFLQ